MAFTLASVLACHSTHTTAQRAVPLHAAETDSISTARGRSLYTNVPARDASDSMLAARADQAMRAIDSLAAADTTLRSYVARLADGRFVRLTPAQDELPDSAEFSDVIVGARGKRVLAVVESPVSESGDWSIQTTHYFDSTGATVAVTHFSGFFAGCVDAKTDSSSGLHETVTSYFGARHRLVKRTFVREKFDGSALAPTDECSDRFQTGYDIYPSWDSLAAATHLRDFVRESHD